MRPEDRARLFELHPTESGLLRDYYASAAPRVLVHAGDGVAGMKAVLPPPEEEKHVKTAIGAARAEAARKSMM